MHVNDWFGTKNICWQEMNKLKSVLEVQKYSWQKTTSCLPNMWKPSHILHHIWLIEIGKNN
jgi:hypothetical protein